jgi:hypothetical protein
MVRIRLGCLSAAFVLSSGCAAQRVAAPAQSIASAVAAFQADLSRFQETTHTVQATEAFLAQGNDRQRQIALLALDQKRTEAALTQAPGFPEMLTILQTQANTRVAPLITPPQDTVGPASAAVPVEKLSTVTKLVQQIAKPPGTKENLQALVDFAKNTNADLSALEKEKTPAKK